MEGEFEGIRIPEISNAVSRAMIFSLYSRGAGLACVAGARRLEVVGERENGRARGRHARVSFSRARFSSKRLLRRLVRAGYPLGTRCSQSVGSRGVAASAHVRS